MITWIRLVFGFLKLVVAVAVLKLKLNGGTAIVEA